MGNATPPEEDPVARLDRILSQRLETIAQSKGVSTEKILPKKELRDAALATHDLGSAEAKNLIAEYSRIFKELTGEAVPAP